MDEQKIKAIKSLYAQAGTKICRHKKQKKMTKKKK